MADVILFFQAASELLVPKITMSFANEDTSEDNDTGNGKIGHLNVQISIRSI